MDLALHNIVSCLSEVRITKRRMVAAARIGVRVLVSFGVGVRVRVSVSLRVRVRLRVRPGLRESESR